MRLLRLAGLAVSAPRPWLRAGTLAPIVAVVVSTLLPCAARSQQLDPRGGTVYEIPNEPFTDREPDGIPQCAELRATVVYANLTQSLLEAAFTLVVDGSCDARVVLRGRGDPVIYGVVPAGEARRFRVPVPAGTELNVRCVGEGKARADCRFTVRPVTILKDGRIVSGSGVDEVTTFAPRRGRGGGPPRCDDAPPNAFLSYFSGLNESAVIGLTIDVRGTCEVTISTMVGATTVSSETFPVGTTQSRAMDVPSRATLVATCPSAGGRGRCEYAITSVGP